MISDFDEFKKPFVELIVWDLDGTSNFQVNIPRDQFEKLIALYLKNKDRKKI